MQETRLRYVIKFVADMDTAVKFYRDVLCLKVTFESPGWSEFLTVETTLALHPASEKNAAGKCRQFSRAAARSRNPLWLWNPSPRGSRPVGD